MKDCRYEEDSAVRKYPGPTREIKDPLILKGFIIREHSDLFPIIREHSDLFPEYRMYRKNKQIVYLSTDPNSTDVDIRIAAYEQGQALDRAQFQAQQQRRERDFNLHQQLENQTFYATLKTEITAKQAVLQSKQKKLQKEYDDLERQRRKVRKESNTGIQSLLQEFS